MGMKTTILFLSVFIGAVFTLEVSAKAKCMKCHQFVDVRQKIDFERDETMDPARTLLERFKFSKNAEQRAMEVEAYLELALVMLKKDATGNSHSYLYSASIEYPEEFKAAIDKLPPKNKKFIEDAILQTKAVFEEGNG